MTKISEAILKNTRGMTLVLHDPLVVQALRPRVDFFVLDGAARPCSPEIIATLYRAAGDKPFLVRPAATDPATLQGLLNIGVDGFVLPGIRFAAELEKIIAACLYPPEGHRAYRPLLVGDMALEAINDQITFIVDIDHPQTVAQLEQIAEVTGLNGLLVAPSRLAMAMEQGMDTDHATVQRALQAIARVAQSYELPCGIEGTGGMDFNADFTVTSRDLDFLLAAPTTAKPATDSGEMAVSSFPGFLSARRE